MLSDLTTLILAGGLGTRLRSVVQDRPKALAPVKGRPFLAYLLDQVVASGIRRVVLCTGHGGDAVRGVFGNRQGALEIAYSQETEALGTGGAIRHAFSQIDSDPVLVLNGDSFCEVHLHTFLAWHRARRAQGSVVLAQVPRGDRYGRVEIDAQGMVGSFREKEEGECAGLGSGGWINAGMYWLSRELIEAIPDRQVVSLERDVLPGWLGRGLYGYAGGGRFLDIGTPESYQEAERFFPHQEPSNVLRPVDGGSPRHLDRPRRFVVLDRDGTLNAERSYLTDPRQVELLPGVLEGLKRLRDLELGLVVVTNQSAIGRGLLDAGVLGAIHAHLKALLAQGGITLDGIYVCPHRPEDACRCRKPEPGLMEQAARALSFDPSQAFVVGDKACDMELGRRVGATTFLMTSGYGREALKDPDVRPDFVVETLGDVAEVIVHLMEHPLLRG